jgi:trimethylamine:corrinoid methyltransferase-like protein
LYLSVRWFFEEKRLTNIKPIQRNLQLEVLSPTELEEIRSGTLRVLNEVGVIFPSERALKKLSDYGAKVNFDTSLVRIKPDLVAHAMDKAPRSYLLIPEQIIFDDEIYHTHRILTQGLNINQIGLALDIIEQVGPGGHFLAQKHTRSNLRERWIPRLTNPQSANGDEPADIQMRARAELDRILDEHQPKPLDKTVQNELVSILEAAESEFIH